MQPSFSQKIRSSLIQLAVGLILLCFVGIYLSNHPAELQSMKSSFETAVQKVKKIVSSGSGSKESELAQLKTSVLTYLDETLYLAASCSQMSGSLDEHQQLRTEIYSSTLEDFAERQGIYLAQIHQFLETVSEKCE